MVNLNCVATGVTLTLSVTLQLAYDNAYDHAASMVR